MSKALKIILLFQGVYYISTAFWAIVSLDSFSQVTGHFGDPFEMHSIAALALVLGIFFIWGVIKEEVRKYAAFLALGTAITVIIPELIYLPKIGNPILFWIDFIEESIVALLLTMCLLAKHKNFLQTTS